MTWYGFFFKVKNYIEGDKKGNDKIKMLLKP